MEDFSRRKGNPTNNPKPITQNQIYQASAPIRLQSSEELLKCQRADNKKVSLLWGRLTL